jgi:hypothetical protein
VREGRGKRGRGGRGKREEEGEREGGKKEWCSVISNSSAERDLLGIFKEEGGGGKEEERRRRKGEGGKEKEERRRRKGEGGKEKEERRRRKGEGGKEKERGERGRRREKSVIPLTSGWWSSNAPLLRDALKHLFLLLFRLCLPLR